MPRKKTDKQKLRIWQERLQRNMADYEAEEGRMDDRETLYKGGMQILPIVQGERKRETPHVRNICAECHLSRRIIFPPPGKRKKRGSRSCSRSWWFLS